MNSVVDLKYPRKDNATGLHKSPDGQIVVNKIAIDVQ